MIYVTCPDNNSPVGGIKVLYRHVDVLRQLGMQATIVHQRPGFRCTWFENDTPVTHRAALALEADDFVVMPEVCGPDAASRTPGVAKVIFNQSGSLTFRDYPLDGSSAHTPYVDPDVVATLVISERVKHYMEHAFPAMPALRVRWSLDSTVFRQNRDKKHQICFMPRRNVEEARQVFNILRYRGALEGYSLVPIEGMGPRDVARVMGESMFFFSFGYPEGLPLPPAEAMACGCVVVGYHGFGGAEYFKEDICHPVSVADVLEFSAVAERVLKEGREAPEEVLNRGDRAAEHIAREYSPAREIEEIEDAWKRIIDLAP